MSDTTSNVIRPMRAPWLCESTQRVLRLKRQGVLSARQAETVLGVLTRDAAGVNRSA